MWHTKEDVVGSAKPLGGRVQIFRVKALPASCIQTLNQRLQRSYRFCCCEGAVPCMMHKRLAQERAMGCAGDNGRIGLLVLHRHGVIVGGVQSQDRYFDATVEDNVLTQVIDRRWICHDPRCVVEHLEVGIQTQAGLLVQCLHFAIVDGECELFLVINSRVPRRVTTCAGFQFSASGKEEKKVKIVLKR